MPLITGVIFVATSAFLSAVFLVRDSRRFDDAGDGELLQDAGRWWPAPAAGASPPSACFVYRAEDRYIYDGSDQRRDPPGDRLGPLRPRRHRAALAAIGRAARGPLAAGAVVTMIWAWGVAQFPYLLPQSLTISQAAAVGATLKEILIVFVGRRGPRPAVAGLALLTRAARHRRGEK